jgi:hypothetical protein
MAENEKKPDVAEPVAKVVDSDERARDRSPSFPFISLEDAIGRATSFEVAHRRYSARISVAAETWKISAKSSTMLQTVAALKAYGLMKDSGAGSERKIELTDLAQRILKDARPGNRATALKEAALKPRLIAEHWLVWGAERPPDATCRSDLHLDEGFTEEAAVRFLRVYDATISYAALTAADKPPEQEAQQDNTPAARGEHSRSTGGSPNVRIQPPAGSIGVSGGTPKMLAERTVFSQEIEGQHSLKLLVTGPVDEALLDALGDFVNFQRNRLKRISKSESSTSENQKQNTDDLLT